MAKHLVSPYSAFTAIFLSMSILASRSAALYTSSDAVVMLKDDNFHEAVIRYDGVALVEFFAPWCGHCKSFAPQFKKIAEKLKGIALVAAVDCNDANSKKTCMQYQVQSFPTIKVFPAEKQKNPYTGDFNKEAEIYVGPRTVRPIIDAVESQLRSEYITPIRSVKDLDAFKAKHADWSKVVLYTNKEKATLLYNALSTTLRNKLAFALVHDSATEVVEAAGVTSFPTVHVIKPDGENVVYDQEMKAPVLKEFLEGFAPADSAERPSEPPSTKAEPKLPLPPVTNLTVANLTDINTKEDTWLIAFYAASAEECQVHIARYLEVLRDLRGMVNTALLQVTAEEVPALPEAYGLDTAALIASPCQLQIVHFPFGEEKMYMEDYEVYKGELEGKALQKWVAEKVPDFTTQVNGDTIMRFLAAGLGSPGDAARELKVMLYTNKPEAPPTFRALAGAFRTRARYTFGFMNVGTEENKKAIKVTKVPMLALAMPILKDGQVQLVQEPYNGPMKFAQMYAWLEMMAKQLKLMVDDPDADAGDELPEIASAAQFEELCGSKPGLCVIGLMHPEHPKDKEVNAAISELASERDEQPLHFSKVNALRQPHLTAALGVMRSDLPTVAVISPKKLRYAVMTEEVSERALGALLDALLSGKARTEALQELPKIVDGGVEPGTTVDASAVNKEEEAPAVEEEPVEEEFDLSDIMNEDISEDVGAAADKLKEVEQQLKEEEEARKKQEQEQAKKGKKKKKGKKGKKAKKEKQQEQGEIKDEL